LGLRFPTEVPCFPSKLTLHFRLQQLTSVVGAHLLAAALDVPFVVVALVVAGAAYVFEDTFLLAFI